MLLYGDFPVRQHFYVIKVKNMMAGRDCMIKKPKEEWHIWNKAGDFEEIGKRCGVDRLLAKIMINRGGTKETAYSYFHGEISDLGDPFLMKGLREACDFIADMSRRCGCGETAGAAIAADYDADGLFSGFSLHRAFDRLGIPNKIFIPDRVEEGYGLNERIVRQAKEEGFNLLITCDNGIAAIKPVLMAKELGMTVIVTDHHDIHYVADERGEKVNILPEADIIIDPKQEGCAYPFKQLCGTGVVYMLIKAVYEKTGIPKEEMDEFLGYAAIATITDIMPLTGENRIIVKHGLRKLSECKNMGLNALFECCGLDKSHITSYNVGFIIGPSINATGRITKIQEALDLLLETDYVQAHIKAEEIRKVNEERQKMTEEYKRKAFDLIEGITEPDEHNAYMGDKVISLYLKGAHESIVGLVAGKVKERYNMPVLIFTDAHEEGVIKGSGRSTETYNMFEGLSAYENMLLHFGGHPMAAGFSMKMEYYEELKRRLNEDSGLTDEALIHRIYIDEELYFGSIREEVLEQFSLLEPFGSKNRPPSFGERMVRIRHFNRIGKNKNYMKLDLVNRRGENISAVYFADADDFLSEMEEFYGKEEKENFLNGRNNNIYMNIVYCPEINEFRGQKSIQAQIKRHRFKKVV